MTVYLLKSIENQNSWLQRIMPTTSRPLFTEDITKAAVISDFEGARETAATYGGMEVRPYNLTPAVVTSDVEVLTSQLVDLLEALNKIRPVQFLDEDAEFVTNYIGVDVDENDDRVYIRTSAYYDNLPSRASNPLKNSRGDIIPPKS